MNRYAHSTPAAWLAPLLLATTALAADIARAQALAQSSSPFVPVTDEVLQDPDPADWLMWRRTLDGWGFRNRYAVTY